MGILAAERLRTEECANLVATTAPLSSDLGVEIRFSGVTFGLAHRRETETEPSARPHLIQITAAKASLDPSKKQIS